MNARRLVSDEVARLEAAGVPEALIKAEWWVSESLGVDRADLDVVFPDEEQAERIAAGIARLERHEPLQYVIGHAPFLDVRILTDRRALIPRPETEELVMKVCGCRELWSNEHVRIADVGTGTGCIAIALAARYGNAQVVATDVSDDALALARENAQCAGVGDRIAFRQCHLLEGVAGESLDAVVSNPPYIVRGVIATLEESVRCYEPMAALDGGEDGLDVIRPLIDQAFTALKKGGRLWLEIGDEQGPAVDILLKEAGFRDVGINRDMFGQIRFAEGRK